MDKVICYLKYFTNILQIFYTYFTYIKNLFYFKSRVQTLFNSGQTRPSSRFNLVRRFNWVGESEPSVSEIYKRKICVLTSFSLPLSPQSLFVSLELSLPILNPNPKQPPSPLFLTSKAQILHSHGFSLRFWVTFMLHVGFDTSKSDFVSNLQHRSIDVETTSGIYIVFKAKIVFKNLDFIQKSRNRFDFFFDLKTPVSNLFVLMMNRLYYA